MPILFAVVATATPVFTPLYNVTDLGTLGGSTSVAYGLSPNGQVVGMSTTTFGNMHAVEFGLSGLTDLTVHSPAAEGLATGVNNGGQISGTQWIGGQAYATVWDNGLVQTIAGPGSYAQAIDAQGDIVGMLTASNGQGHAFVTKNGSLTDLGTPLGGAWSSAYAMNNSASVAGYAMVGSSMSAFVWSPATGYTILGTLGGANGFAMAINAFGVAAGHAQNAAGYLHAVIWSAGSVRDLGTLEGNASFAFGLNDTGEAVGYSSLPGNVQTDAFLFDGARMLDLNALIAPGSGWTLTQAYSINNGGQIVGAGMFDGVEHAFMVDLVTPQFGAAAVSATAPAVGGFPSAAPEPPTWTFVLLGIAGIAIRCFLSIVRLPRRRKDRPPEPPQSTAAP
jgi:probable HAF family extracellular repeat protein